MDSKFTAKMTKYANKGSIRPPTPGITGPRGCRLRDGSFPSLSLVKPALELEFKSKVLWVTLKVTSVQGLMLKLV